jgi:hypothetical protein
VNQGVWAGWTSLHVVWVIWVWCSQCWGYTQACPCRDTRSFSTWFLDHARDFWIGNNVILDLKPWFGSTLWMWLNAITTEVDLMIKQGCPLMNCNERGSKFDPYCNMCAFNWLSILISTFSPSWNHDFIMSRIISVPYPRFDYCSCNDICDRLQLI